MSGQGAGARDDFDGLRCQVPGCRHVVRAFTGLQELDKMRKHLARAHLAKITPGEALELRAKWERQP